MAIEDIKDLADRVPNLRPVLDDEAKTKQFLILPLIRALGYDDANPAEVVPEYAADFGTRSGWKADYALMSGEGPLIVMECKQLSNKLSTDEINQLGRYFSFVPFAGAKIGILTNGVIYKFFTDEAEANKMDEEPFWQVNLETLNDNDLTQFKNFTKDDFDPVGAVETASRFKYISGMKEVLNQQYHHQPDDTFAEWLARPLLPPRSRMTQDIKEMAQQALREFVEELVTALLRGSQTSTSVVEEAPSEEFVTSPEEMEEPLEGGRNTETTDEELEGYAVVKAIVGEVVDSDRVVLRDAQQYCAVFLDENNRRPLCRFHFNRPQKYIGLFDGSRSSSGAQLEKRHAIESLQEIHNHAEQLRETARRYLES